MDHCPNCGTIINPYRDGCIICEIIVQYPDNILAGTITRNQARNLYQSGNSSGGNQAISFGGGEGI